MKVGHIDLEHFKRIWIYSFLFWILILSTNLFALLPPYIYTFISTVFSVFALFFIASKVIKNKSIYIFDQWLFFLLLSIVISCIVNFKYGVVDNLKEIIRCVIYLLFIYSDEDISKSIPNFKKIFSVLVFFLSFISLCTFFLEYDITILNFENKIVRIGFVENRLFGLYMDPNYASILSLICSFFCIEKIFENKNRIFHIINLIIQVFYMSLSNSRTCQFTLLVCLFLCTFVILYRKYFFKIKPFMKMFLVIICSSICSVISVAILRSVALTLIGVSNVINQKYNPEAKKISFERKDTNRSHDLSNGRLEIWMSALEVFRKKWLFGTSPKNMIRYAEDKFPDGRIAIKKNIVHNAYLNSLVSIGIFGSLFFFWFLTKNACAIIKRYYNNLVYSQPCKLNLDVMVISCIAVLVSAIVLNEILFVNTAGTLLFWMFSGEINRKII